MCKIYEQTFQNNLKHILILIWLIRLNVAGQSALAVLAPNITMAEIMPQTQVENMKNLEKHVIKPNELDNYRNYHNIHITNTSKSTTANITNTLNVNNTDTQMTLKLKDAKAINVDMTYCNKTFIFVKATGPTYKENIDRTSDRWKETLATVTPYKTSTNKPATVESIYGHSHIKKTFRSGQLLQDKIKSPEKSVLLNQSISFTTQPYTNSKRKSSKKRATAYFNNQKNLKISVLNTKKTSMKNLTTNNVLIKKTDLNWQQHTKDLKAKQEKYDEKEITPKLNEISGSLQAVSGKKFQKIPERKKLAYQEEKPNVKSLNIIYLNLKENEKQNDDKREQEHDNKFELSKQKAVVCTEYTNCFREIPKLPAQTSGIKDLTTMEFTPQNLPSNLLSSPIAVKKNKETKAIDIKQQFLTTLGPIRNNMQSPKDALEVNEAKDNVENLKMLFKFEDIKISSNKKNGFNIKNISLQREDSGEKLFFTRSFPSANKEIFKEILEQLPKSSQSKALPYVSASLRNFKTTENLSKLETKFGKKLHEVDRQIDKLKKQRTNNKKQNEQHTARNLTRNSKRNIKDSKSTDGTRIKKLGINVREEKTEMVEAINEQFLYQKFKKFNSNIPNKNNSSEKFSNQNINTRVVPSNLTFHRQKRLNGSNRETHIQSFKSPQKSLAENSTEIYHNDLPKNKPITVEPMNFKWDNDNKSLPIENEQTEINIRQANDKFRNESIETENMRQLNFIDQHKQLALNEDTENGNNILTRNRLINKKQLDANLDKYHQIVDNGKHTVSEINTNKMETTRPPTSKSTTIDEEAITKTSLISDINRATATPTAATATEPFLLEFYTTLITAPITKPTPRVYQFNNFEHNVENTTTPHLFTTSSGILPTHGLINNKLTTGNADTATKTSENTSSIIRLASTASTFIELPLLYATTTPSLHTPLISMSTTSATTPSSWPVKHAAVMEGNVILGGLMMVHSREDSITCGPIMPQGGIQALEAMLYTLDQVNKQQLLPNITLGAHILDDCDKDTYGLEMAVDFIKGESCIMYLIELILLLDKFW